MSQVQRKLFTDPNVQTKLSRQQAAILARLREGSATNRELSFIALKYGARITELKKKGYQIECFSVSSDPKGVNRFRLIGGGA